MSPQQGNIVPPSCGFPPKSFPLKWDPPFWGKPSALGHEGYRGRRLCGAAMLCRYFASRPRHSLRRRRLARGLRPVQVWLGGSTPNKCSWEFKYTPKECTSCSRTPRTLVRGIFGSHAHLIADATALRTRARFVGRKIFKPSFPSVWGGVISGVCMRRRRWLLLCRYLPLFRWWWR